MFEELKRNIEGEKKIIEQVNSVYSKLKNTDGKEKQAYLNSLEALKKQLKILNDSIPSLVGSISPIKKLDTSTPEKKPEDVANVKYSTPVKEGNLITIKKGDIESFAKELNLSNSALKDLKKSEKEDQDKQDKVIADKPDALSGIANKFFLKISEKIAPSFNNIHEDLKRSNMKYTLSTYISIALLVSLLTFILSFAVFIAFIVLGILSAYYIFVPFFLVIASAGIFYIYPSSEKDSVDKKISEELPFVTIYLSAIAGSNIEPTKIFRVIAESGDYPAISTELKKMMMQVEIYGYDLVSALKNSAQKIPNERFAELLSGVATNITSGGSLKSYLEKKAENFLLDYKLERQRYSAVAETFMDIYISLLVAAPMILILLVIIMNVTGMGIGISADNLLVLTIGGVVLLNIVFLIILDIKQPKT